MVIRKRRRFAPFENPVWSLIVKPESKFNRQTKEFFTVDTRLLVKHKNAKANVKLQHQKVFELSLAMTLAFLIITFQIAKEFSLNVPIVDKVDAFVKSPTNSQNIHHKASR